MKHAHLPYHQRPVEDAFTHFETSAKGLSATQAHERLQRDGPNVLPVPPKTPLVRAYLRQLSNDPTIAILLAAALFAYSIEYSLISYALLAFVVINPALRFMREYLPGAGGSFADIVPRQARVRRGNAVHDIHTKNIVVGDIVELHAGAMVPADLRLAHVDGLVLNNRLVLGTPAPYHAAVHPSSHDTIGNAHSVALQGAAVVAGSGSGVVIATGTHTELGSALNRLGRAQTPASPLDTAISHIVTRSTQALLLAAAVVVLAGLPFGLGYEQSLWFVLALVLIIIPLALPGVVNAALTHAAAGLARLGAFVRRLSAADTLGLADVAVVDAHDVLAHHTPAAQQLTIARRTFTVGTDDTAAFLHPDGKPFQPDELDDLQFMCSAAVLAGFPHTAKTAHDLAVRSGLDAEELMEANTELRALPFDTIRQRAGSVRTFTQGGKTQNYVFVGGNAETVLEQCRDIWVFGHVRKLTAADKKFIASQLTAAENNGQECAAFAYRVLPARTKAENLTPEDAEQNLVWLGFMTLSRPLRSEIEVALQRAHDTRLSIAALTTGDPIAAESLAKHSGLHVTGGEIMRINRTELADLSDDKVAALLHRGGVIFHDLTPPDRERLVAAAAAHHHRIALTGSGLADLPALTAASTGILLAPDKTVQAGGEIVLKHTGLGLLVATVQRGRALHRNLRKATLGLFEGAAAKLTVVLLSFVSIAVFDVPVAIALIHLLLLVAIVELLPAAALGRDRTETDQPRVKARELTNRVLDRTQAPLIVWSGLLVGSLAFINYLLYFQRHDLPAGLVPADTPIHWKAMTLVVLTLALCQLATLFMQRSHHGLFTRHQLHNAAFWGAGIFMIIALWLLMYLPVFSQYFKLLPLTLLDWLFALLAVAVYIAMQEFIRYDRRHHRHHLEFLSKSQSVK